MTATPHPTSDPPASGSDAPPPHGAEDRPPSIEAPPVGQGLPTLFWVGGLFLLTAAALFLLFQSPS